MAASKDSTPPGRKLRKLAASLVGAAAAMLLLPPSAGAVNLSYTFSGGDEGWRSSQSNAGPFSVPDFNPTGYISDQDTGPETGCGTPNPPCELFYFASPGTSVTLAANYGGTLSFDFASSTTPEFTGVIYLDSTDDAAPELLRMFEVLGAGFQRITAPLTPAGWQYCSGTPYTCTPATQPQFRAALASATFTDVLGDVADGTGETYSLDNFTVSEKPKPKKCKKKGKGKKRAAAAKKGKKKCKPKKKGKKRSAQALRRSHIWAAPKSR